MVVISRVVINNFYCTCSSNIAADFGVMQMPKLAAHMEEEGVLPTMYCSQWFLTLYAYTLPIEHLLRVWDIFLLEGSKILFRQPQHLLHADTMTTALML